MKLLIACLLALCVTSTPADAQWWGTMTVTVVVDAAGVPVAGATVSINTTARITSAAGTAAFTVRPATLYTVVVARAGYLTWTGTWTGATSGTLLAHLTTCDTSGGGMQSASLVAGIPVSRDEMTSASLVAGVPVAR